MRFVEHVNPGLLAAKGVGVVTAAQLLITSGDNPKRVTSAAAVASAPEFIPPGAVTAARTTQSTPSRSCA